MHVFSQLVDRCTAFILVTLNEAEEQVIAELQTTGATRHVKNLQTFQLQRVITAVGMFSIFDAELQNGHVSNDGFAEARKILLNAAEAVLAVRFDQFVDAINVLKHGRGRSYERLLSQINALPFRLKRPEECFFQKAMFQKYLH